MARTTRRDVLRIGAILAVAGFVMARPWQGLVAPRLDFEVLNDLPPLRRLAGAGAAAGAGATSAVLIGLDPPGARSGDMGISDRLRQDLCGALGLPWQAEEPVPVTYFTDINCPVCRRMEADLAALEGQGARFRLITREYPVFGPRSEAAARVIRAGAGQGAEEALRALLHARPAPDTAAGVAALGDRLGLDAARLIADWSGPEVARSLAEDRALARLLAMPGTPGLVVGRTIVIGRPPRQSLSALLALEHEEGPPEGCPRRA